eukprot:SAG31_NODE_1078_length_10032_cov_4.602034_7_plen_163_part_00
MLTQFVSAGFEADDSYVQNMLSLFGTTSAPGTEDAPVVVFGEKFSLLYGVLTGRNTTQNAEQLPAGWTTMYSRRTGELYYGAQSTASHFHSHSNHRLNSMTLWHDVAFLFVCAVNTATGDSQFERPELPADQALPPNWVAMISRTNGEVYYANQVSCLYYPC